MDNASPNDSPSDQRPALDRLLTGLVERVPHARSALLLTVDGAVRAAHGLDRETAEQLAALASGLHALARGAGTRFADGGPVRQVVVEWDAALLSVRAAGNGACLAALADRHADAAVLGFEMTLLVRSVRSVLESPLRLPVGR
ncbi:Predicted regulator of Ras-like GTPase activity, Roadblock/LC7/MglB family [Streptomyces zhaozhouensis]|uniref:Predicted regulator of Ras-like GTPase activity, Roadblock/LC7/MglB family n=1 Tax=Streptomyces zhaozhouensis TaxID=1300267 RepID=A0A286DV15_9ACTN|nr:roadblock/LC7 domain-containing protein [Streptomyces zhaozhouensis]SOD62404.1 Predicted regulator of Ras-like GTPase activity, Roadblock/LC7/MglB family [Streptomyces zhaozhouensis]